MARSGEVEKAAIHPMVGPAEALRFVAVRDAGQHEATHRASERHVDEPFVFFFFAVFDPALDRLRQGAHPGETSTLPTVNAHFVRSRRRGTSSQEHHGGFEPLGLVDRHDLNGGAVSFETLHVALEIEGRSRSCPKPHELVAQIVEGLVTALGSLGQKLDEVLQVGQGPLAATEEDLPSNDPGFAEHALEKTTQLARICERFPSEQSCDERVSWGQVASSLDGRKRQSEEGREPRRESPCAVARIRDGREQDGEVARLFALEKALLFVEGMGHAELAKCFADDASLARRAREHESVLRPQGAAAELPRAKRVGHAADLTRNHARDPLERGLSLESKEMDRRHGTPVAIDELSVGPAASNGRVAHVPREDGTGSVLVENDVGRVDERLRGSIALFETQPLAARVEHRRARGQVRRHVGPAKSIDGLLRVAHQNTKLRVASKAIGSKKARRNMRPLRLVGVLELIDECVAPTTPQRLGESCAVRSAQRFVDEQQHVVEVVTTGSSLASAQRRSDDGQERLRQARRERWRRRNQLRSCRAHGGGGPGFAAEAGDFSSASSSFNEPAAKTYRATSPRAPSTTSARATIRRATAFAVLACVPQAPI